MLSVLDVRNIYFVYQNTSKLAILMLPDQIDEKQYGWKKEHCMGSRGEKSYRSALPPHPSPLTLQVSAEWRNGTRMTFQVSFRSKRSDMISDLTIFQTWFLNGPLSGYSFIQSTLLSAYYRLKTSEVNPQWIGDEMVWWRECYYTT